MLRHETPTGAINGINRVFNVSVAYVATSTEVFLNGSAKIAADTDGWDETDPLTGIFTMKVAPRTGNRLLIAFRVV